MRSIAGDIETLADQVGKKMGFEGRRLAEEYLAAGGQAETDAFLRHLQDSKLIDAAMAAELRQAGTPNIIESFSETIAPSDKSLGSSDDRVTPGDETVIQAGDTSDSSVGTVTPPDKRVDSSGETVMPPDKPHDPLAESTTPGDKVSDLLAETIINKRSAAELLSDFEATIHTNAPDSAHTDSVDEEATLILERQGGAVRAPREGGRAVSESRYDLLNYLSRGAMGELHVARDKKLLRRVAYKNILSQFAHAPRVQSQFITEAQLTAQLDHPNIVPVHGLESTPDGTVAYAMKLVDGQEFASFLKEAGTFHRQGKPTPSSHKLKRRLELFLNVCDAISFAHDRGVLHRDLKPANIMIGAFNEVYVMDWGIACLLQGSTPTSDRETPSDAATQHPIQLSGEEGSQAHTCREKLLVGTPRYMSPEQAAVDTSRMDGRSDLYSLGLILQEVVTLGKAVDGNSIEEFMERAKRGERNAIVHISPRVRIDFELVAIINKATKLNPDARYATVGAFADDLRRYLRGDAVQAKPDNLPRKMSRWIAKNRTKALMSMVLMALTGIFISIALHQQMKLTNAQRHEILQSNFISRVALHTLSVDKELQRYVGILDYLAGNAQALLEHADPAPGAVRWRDAFHDKAPNRPEDWHYSPYYREKVSFRWPVSWRSTPGSSRQGRQGLEQTAHIEKLSWLRNQFSRLMLSSFSRDAHLIKPKEAIERLSRGGAPLHQLFVTLKDGSHVSYPGKALNLAEGNQDDARNHPAYRLATGNTGTIQWGTPYVDNALHSLVIPASTALIAETGEVLGVASFEMTLGYIIKYFLDIPELDYLQESMLIDVQGRILAHRSHGEMKRQQLVQYRNKSLPLKPIPYAGLIQRLQTEEAGTLQTTHEGRQLLIVFESLETANWFFVAVADHERMVEMIKAWK